MHRFLISAACALIIGVPVAHADRINDLTWALAGLNVAGMECPVDVPDNLVVEVVMELLKDKGGYDNIERSYEIGAVIVYRITKDKNVRNAFCMEVAKGLREFEK